MKGIVLKYCWISLLGLILLFYGCRTGDVPLASVNMNSLINTSLVRDSVFVKDSIFIREKGDTVYQYRNRYTYIDKVVVDTFYIYIDKEVKVPVPVERKLGWWERMKMDFGGWLLVLVAVYVVCRMVKWWVKRTRKG